VTSATSSAKPASTTVVVKILDKDYQVSCGADEVDALNASARLLDRQMKTIREGGKVVGLDRIAVMAALNIANDMLRTQTLNSSSDERIERLTRRVKDALAEQKQLNL
jgi:cell division protein ZapA